MFDRMMVAYDGSEPSRRALVAGLDLARQLGKPLRTVTVIEEVPAYLTTAAFVPMDGGTMAQITEQQEAYGRRLCEEVEAAARQAGVPVETESLSGHETDTIVEAVIRHDCDLLIVGLRTHPGLVDRLMAHTHRDLSERAPCSVLGVK